MHLSIPAYSGQIDIIYPIYYDIDIAIHDTLFRTQNTPSVLYLHIPLKKCLFFPL